MKGLKIISWSLAIVWMVIIFVFSQQTAENSDEISRNIVTRYIIEHFDGYKEMSQSEQTEFADALDFIVRKLAHFTEYAILGLLYTLILYSYKINIKAGVGKLIMISTVLCLFYAASDEIHQLFIEGRSGNVRDVLIDTMGGLFGTIVTILMIKIFRLWKNKVICYYRKS